jgi:murein DD-endopeptidase MepM/ murein hydrolase activator NlpD
VLAYNHANWYVDEVMSRAQVIAEYTLTARRKNGYSLPLDARYMTPLGRTDDGVDIENAPDGAPVYSMTPGVVTAVASDPSGFGPNYPVILVTKGPMIGRYIYYGHVAASLVHVGEHVAAGQRIAIMGHTGDAASLGHGHIEIGFSDSGGNPLNHHGATAWTPAGDAMRRLLESLSAAPAMARDLGGTTLQSLPAAAATMLTNGQQQFASQLAADTGLDPRVITAWLLAEESGGAAQSRESANNNDWLNIGYTDSATYGAADPIWADPITAADATALWLQGQNTVAGYGTASSGIQAILQTAGQSPAAQIAAIQHSGWASGGYPDLPGLYQQVGA